MKRWLVPALVVAALAALAATAPWWLPPFLAFVGANSDLIQGLTDLVQLILWICAGIAGLLGLWRTRKPGIAPPEQTPEVGPQASDRASGTDAPGVKVRDGAVAHGAGATALGAGATQMRVEGDHRQLLALVLASCSGQEQAERGSARSDDHVSRSRQVRDLPVLAAGARASFVLRTRTGGTRIRPKPS